METPAVRLDVYERELETSSQPEPILFLGGPRNDRNPDADT